MALEKLMKIKNTLTKKEKEKIIAYLKKENKTITGAIKELKKPVMNKELIRKAYDSFLFFNISHNVTLKFQEMLGVFRF